MRQILLLCACLLLAGCPAANKGGGSTKAAAPDEHDAYAKSIQNETGAADELKRLQGLYTEAAQPGGSGQENADYTLAVETAEGAVAVVLTSADGAETWRLSVWTPATEQNLPITVIKDEPATGGHYFEASLGEALTLSLQLRWLAGGTLQVTRSLLLGGLDLTYAFEPGNGDWVFSGPWLPYRLAPQADGPWGVVPVVEGTWQAAAYPGACRLPAAAAYDGQRGWLLGVADEHARKADRRYELGWQVNGDYTAGGLLKLSTGYFNSTTDGFDAGTLASGLEQRDSVVLTPLSLSERSIDPTSVEATTAQVVLALGRYLSKYHYTPCQAAKPVAGNVIRLAEWLGEGDEAEQAHTLDLLSATAGVRYALVSEEDLAAGVLTEELAATLAAITVSPIVEYPGGAAGFAAGDVRDAGYAAQLLRQAASGTGQPGAPGLCWRLDSLAPATTTQQAAAGQCVMSALIPQAVLVLRSAELASTKRPDALLLAGGRPSLYLPAFADGYIDLPANQATAEIQVAAGRQASPALFNPLAARLDNLLTAEVFGVHPVVASRDGTLAGLVLAAPGGQAGFMLDQALTLYAGFEAFSKNTAALDWLGLELLTVFSNPIACTYSLEGERPALCQQLIAVTPAQFDGASCVWVVFAGIGGDVMVDNENNLTVNWRAGGEAQAWSQRLPVGYWTVYHPSPEAVFPGDVVLVRKGSVAPASQGGAVSM